MQTPDVKKLLLALKHHLSSKTLVQLISKESITNPNRVHGTTVVHEAMSTAN